MENFFNLLLKLSLELKHPHKQAILQTMLSISWETKMLQWGMTHPMEIRAIIESLGRFDPDRKRQFNRCLRGLVQIVDSVAILGSNR